jgi:hypothetical protein
MLSLIRRLFVKPAPAPAAVRKGPKKKGSTLIRLQRAAAMDMIRSERRK